MADEQTNAISSFPPGSLVGVESSYKEPLQLSEEEQNALRELVRVFERRDMAAYREQVIRVWEKRLFDRGFQHLIPRRNGGWNLPTVGTGYGPGESDSRSIFETNIYNSYQQIITSALTREFPSPRFEPCDPDNDADITAADAAEKLKFGIERDNRMKTLMMDMARYLWTDGEAVFFTHYMKDGQKYGYEDETQEQETVPEDASANSERDISAAESEGMGGGISGNGDSGTSEGLGQVSQEAQPKGGEVICVGGALEFKLPIKAPNLGACDYAIFSEEIQLQAGRAEFPDVADKIHSTEGGAAGDDIDRLARVNTKLGIMDQYVTSDSQIYDVTKQTVWIRPYALLEIQKPEIRDSLMQKASTSGLRAIFCGETFCEARAISMDEQLTLIHALPGDGMHRAGLGDWLVPIQKVLNNWLELLDDYATRGVPNKWMDNEMFDVQKLRDQVNMPGAVHPFDREPGVQMEEAIWEETPLQIPETLWAMAQFFIGELSQLLCGAYPALSGGGDSTPDNVGGTIIQRDQAIGRIGLPWRAIKEGMASMMQQAVICLAKNEQGTIKMLDGSEAIRVDVEDLKGNFMAFPETDENFPESPTQKQNRFALLVSESAANPIYMKLLSSPDNLELAKNSIGMEDLEIPELAARDKQLGENVILLKSGPVPNPMIGQLEQQIQTIQTQLQPIQQMAIMAAKSGQQPDPQHVQQGTQLQAAITQLTQQLQQAQQTPMVSSVPIGKYDNDETELATCVKVINSPMGRELKNGNEDEQAAYQNLELHADEHQAAIAQKKASAPPQTPKPPSISLSLKDMPPKVAAEASTAAGLPATEKDFVAQQIADAAEKHPAGGITQ